MVRIAYITTMKMLRIAVLLTIYLQARAQGDPSWPPVEEVCSLADTLDGELLLPGNPRYDELRELRNTYFTNTPGMIILAKSIDDVRQALSLAREYNLQPTVSSSGHDFIGRSTANNSIHINLSDMTGLDINPDDPDSDTGASAIIETGNNWSRVYEEVDKYGLLALGGSSHSVSLGGYIQGGGHSPMTRSLGLGVDSVLGITMVTANGSLIFVDEEGVHDLDSPSRAVDADTDLFWALLGGGGGTFGIAISFKVKLYQPPPSFFYLLMTFTMQSAVCPDDAGEIMRAVQNWFRDSLGDRRINAYIITSNARNNAPVIGFNGTIMISSLFFGPGEIAMPIYESLINIRPDCLPLVSMRNVSTFWEYQTSMPDDPARPIYINNRFIHEEDVVDDTYIDTMTNGILAHNIPIMCYGCSIGGEVIDAPEGRTSVSPDFRRATQATTCATGWSEEDEAENTIAEFKEWGEKFYQHGYGVYFNEPEHQLENWKIDYWGSMEAYDRLLAVKQRWDPDHIFWCHNCVGSDLRDPPSDTVPSGDRVTHDMCSWK